ncbi:MAG: hypothetical protein U0807_14955 [Candidatus Binatia bacterium]
MNLVLELRPPEGRHYRSWRERIETVAHLSRPDAVHAICEEAHAAGARAIMAVADATIREALVEFQRWRDVPVWAVVPNMQAFIRDLTDLGMVGAARARFLRLRPGDMLRQALGAVTQVGGVLRKDFAVGTTLVANMELAGLRGLRIARLFLHPQVTEIALAGGVTAVFRAVLAQAERLGIEAGLVTNNPVRAAAVLGDELRRFAVIVAPANAPGYKMVPDRAACEALFRTDPTRFYASEVTAGGSIAPEAALAHVRTLGLGGALLDVRTVQALARAAA